MTEVCAVAKRIEPGQELPAGGRAHGRGVEVGEAEALLVQAVDVGGLEDWVAVAGEVAIALVVGEDDQDVGFFLVPWRLRRRR